MKKKKNVFHTIGRFTEAGHTLIPHLKHDTSNMNKPNGETFDEMIANNYIAVKNSRLL